MLFCLRTYWKYKTSRLGRKFCEVSMINADLLVDYDSQQKKTKPDSVYQQVNNGDKKPPKTSNKATINQGKIITDHFPSVFHITE